MYHNTKENFLDGEKLVKAQIEAMTAAEQYLSAEYLIQLFLSSLHANDSISLLQKQEYETSYLEKLADMISAQGNYRRALEIYRHVWQLMKQLSHAKTPNKTVKLTTLAMNTDEARVKFKEGKALYALKDNSSALKELEVIPTKYREVACHMLLGNLYKNSNMKKQAVNSYQEALKLMPLSLEAIEALASLGETYQDITSVISDSARSKASESLYHNSGWLFDYINSLIHKRNGDYEKLTAKLHPVMQKFPQNSLLLMQQGLCAVETERYDQAYIIYMQIRKLDPFMVDKMDHFAVMLHARSDGNELNKLTQDLLSCCTTRPVPWLVAALFSDVKGQVEKAMSLVDKAISLDYKYPLSYILKGKLLLAQGHPKQAAVAYFQANILQKDLMSLTGLIDANLAVGRYNEAITAAKEALILMPKSSTAFTIMGKVLAKNAKGQNEVSDIALKYL
jgi:anaphase-promoting complex subunit 7